MNTNATESNANTSAARSLAILAFARLANSWAAEPLHIVAEDGTGRVLGKTTGAAGHVPTAVVDQVAREACGVVPPGGSGLYNGRVWQWKVEEVRWVE